MNYYHGGWSNGAFIGFHILGFLIFIAIVVIVIRFCIGGRFYHYNHRDANPDDRALRLLKERYAKGEITKEEFEKIRKDIA